MERSRTDKIRLGCEIALSVFSVVLAILFIAVIAQIYYAGGAVTYSRDIVWGKLKYMVAPIIVWIVVVIGCFVLSVLFPTEQKKAAPISAEERVRRLRKRMPRTADVPKAGESDKKRVYLNAEHERYFKTELGRYIIYGAACAFALGVSIYALVYLCRKSNFASGTINTDILRMVKYVFPWIIASFLLFIGALTYERVMAKRELSDMTKLLVACKGLPISRSPLAARFDAIKAALVKKEDAAVMWTRIMVAAVAVAFITVGICDGGAGDVFGKAVAICTECIGLG